MIQVSTIHAGYFKLDGGAMFGIVPSSLWSKVNPPDQNNLCTWAMRCLLIQTPTKKILVDTGIGGKQDKKFRSHFHPHGFETLESSLTNQIIHPDDITDVFLTHLHFDHVGGALKFSKNGKIVPTFANAIYWTNELQYKWATQNPNQKEKASFLPENILPLTATNKIKFIDVQKDLVDWIPGIQVQFAYGHTEAMMLLHIQITPNQKLIYCADLIPSSFHISIPWVMAYDIRPLVTLEEKQLLLDKAFIENSILFFEHDPENDCGTLTRNQKGRIILDKKMILSNALKS